MNNAKDGCWCYQEEDRIERLSRETEDSLRIPRTRTTRKIETKQEDLPDLDALTWEDIQRALA